MSAPVKTMEQRLADIEARCAAVETQRDLLVETACAALGIDGKPSMMMALIELDKMATARKAAAEAVAP